MMFKVKCPWCGCGCTQAPEDPFDGEEFEKQCNLCREWFSYELEITTIFTPSNIKKEY